MTHPPTVETRRFSPRVRRLIADAGPLVALIVLIIVFAVANPVFISPGNIGILLSQAAVPLVIATGLTFVILLGGIDLSVEGVVATSSLVFALTVANDRNDLALGLLGALLAVLAGAVFGLANGLANVKLGIPSFMATLGMGAVVTVGVDLTLPEFREKWELPSVWNELQNRAVPTVLSLNPMEARADWTNAQTPYGSDPFHIALPPLTSLVYLFTGYFLLAVPVTFVVLKRTGRMNWAWASTTPCRGKTCCWRPSVSASGPSRRKVPPTA